MPGRTFIPCILLLALAASVRCGEPESLRAKACALMLAGHESEAVEAYRAAAEQGDTNAEIALGYAWLDGEGVPADPETARHWFARAAKRARPRTIRASGICSTGRGNTNSPAAITASRRNRGISRRSAISAFFWKTATAAPPTSRKRSGSIRPP